MRADAERAGRSVKTRRVAMAGNYWSTGRAFQAQRALAKRKKMGHFAQALADGPAGNISEAARTVGISQQTGSIYFREICHGLGWQSLTPCNCERCLERRAA